MCGTISAQDALVSELSAKLVNDTVILRSFSPDKVIRYHVSDGAWVTDTPRYKIAEAFKITAVRKKDNTLIIEGERQPILIEFGVLTRSPYISPGSIAIDLAGVDLSTLQEKIASELFFNSLDEMKAQLPPELLRPKLDPAAASKTIADCTDKSQRYIFGKNGITPPSLRHSVATEMPDGFNEPQKTSVTVLVTVDEKGNPMNLWVTQASTQAFNDEATKTISRYTFKPARCNNTPISVQIYVDLNFERR